MYCYLSISLLCYLLYYLAILATTVLNACFTLMYQKLYPMQYVKLLRRIVFHIGKMDQIVKFLACTF